MRERKRREERRREGRENGKERSSTSLEGQRGVKESPELIVYHFTSLDPVSLCLSVSNSIKLSINATYLIPSYPPMHSETATCRGSPSSWLSCLHAMPLKPIPIFSIFNISRLIDKNSIKHNSRKIHSIDFPTLLLLSSLYHHHHHHHLPHTSIINQSSYHLSLESKY